MILSLVAILVAAAVALLVDYFRNKKHQLREATVEMKVRQVEKERQLQAPPPVFVDAPPIMVPSQAPSPQIEMVAPALCETEEQEHLPVAFTLPRPMARPVMSSLIAHLPVNDDDTDSKKALSNWLTQRTQLRIVHQEPTPVEVERTDQVVSDSVPSEMVVETPSRAEFHAEYPPVVIDEFLWRTLLEKEEDSEPVPGKDFQFIQTMQPATEPGLPTGFQEARVLQKLIETDPVFSGLVISIGITFGNQEPNGELARSVAAYLRTCLRESDFGSSTADDEYLLICPALTGVAAHRHLIDLSERLWDFQLRAIGSFLMLFSVGGVDVKRESLAEAVASANERMTQTKRSRKPVVTITPAARRRKAN